VRQRQGPQPEVGRSVRHRSKRVLDGVNALQRFSNHRQHLDHFYSDKVNFQCFIEIQQNLIT
jgi:hypothetical protein